MSLPANTAPPEPGRLDDLDDDDRLIGRILTRREILALIGAGRRRGVPRGLRAGRRFIAGQRDRGAADQSARRAPLRRYGHGRASAAVATALPACVVAPELTEGPYYLDVDLERSDIRANTSDGAASDGRRADARLDRVAGRWLRMRADGRRRRGCVALRRARRCTRAIEREQRRLPARLPAHRCERACIVHDDLSRAGTRVARCTSTSRSGPIPEAAAGFEFTSQLFFDDELSRTVYATGVYAQKGPQDQLNESDRIFNQSGGATLLAVTQDGDAYKATFPIAVQLS